MGALCPHVDLKQYRLSSVYGQATWALENQKQRKNING